MHICIFIWTVGWYVDSSTTTCYYSTRCTAWRHIFCGTHFRCCRHYEALFSLLTKWSAKWAPGELNTYIPVQYTSSYGLLGCVYVWPGNFRNVLGLFFAFVLFAGFVVSQGLDSGLAPLSSVPFYASPRTFAAGRRRQAFTFGICMSCMNFCNAHPKWAPPPSPLANSESPALSLYICRDLSVI